MTDINEVFCPTCHGPMRQVTGKNGAFLSCSEYPACKGTIDLGSDGKPAPLCPADAAHGHMRFFATGRKGPWFGCRHYPDCRETLQAPDGDADLTPPLPHRALAPDNTGAFLCPVGGQA